MSVLFDPEGQHRRSLRLQGYDYTQAGAYFVTIVSQDRACLLTTVAYTHGVKTQRWPPFRGRLWQRNYFEHIVRNEDSLHRIRQYIADNPARWTDDPEKPQRIVGAVPGGRPDAEQIFCGAGANPDSDDRGQSHDEEGHPQGVPLHGDELQ